MRGKQASSFYRRRSLHLFINEVSICCFVSVSTLFSRYTKSRYKYRFFFFCLFTIILYYLFHAKNLHTVRVSSLSQAHTCIIYTLFYVGIQLHLTVPIAVIIKNILFGNILDLYRYNYNTIIIRNYLITPSKIID